MALSILATIPRHPTHDREPTHDQVSSQPSSTPPNIIAAVSMGRIQRDISFLPNLVAPNVLEGASTQRHVTEQRLRSNALSLKCLICYEVNIVHTMGMDTDPMPLRQAIPRFIETMAQQLCADMVVQPHNYHTDTDTYIGTSLSLSNAMEQDEALSSESRSSVDALLAQRCMFRQATAMGTQMGLELDMEFEDESMIYTQSTSAEPQSVNRHRERVRRARGRLWKLDPATLGQRAAAGRRRHAPDAQH